MNIKYVLEAIMNFIAIYSFVCLVSLAVGELIAKITKEPEDDIAYAWIVSLIWVSISLIK